MSAHKIPYWRLASFYFFYFAIFGAWAPYWGLYLDEQGLEPLAISVIFAAAVANKVVAPNLWGAWGDHLGDHLVVIRIGTFCAALFFAAILFELSFVGLLLVTLAYSFFWNAVLSQFEVVTFGHLGADAAGYGRIRLWGSVGFIAAVAALGALFDSVSLLWLPHVLFVLLACLFLSSLAVPRPPVERGGRKGDLKGAWRIALRPTVLVFLCVCFLNQMAHGSYYAFFSLYLHEHGHSRAVTGAAWSVAVAMEIVFFLFAQRLLAGFSLQRALAFSLLFAMGRWALLASAPEHLALLFLAQFLHAASFGCFHLCAIQLVQRFFAGRYEGQGQAFYSAVSYGAGVSLGALLAGALWELGATWIFWASFAVTVLAWLLAQTLNRRMADGA